MFMLQLGFETESCTAARHQRENTCVNDLCIRALACRLLRAGIAVSASPEN